MSWEPRPYNWFVYDAVVNLLGLMGIEQPTEEQYEQAERVVYSIEGYVSTRG
jgi:hypothetical protein